MKSRTVCISLVAAAVTFAARPGWAQQFGMPFRFEENRGQADSSVTFGTYDSPGGNETPTDIAVDRNGNIYVSYITFDAIDLNEFALVVRKISRDGTPGYLTKVWEIGTNTFANSIVLDESGNLYVVGTADNTPPSPMTVPTVRAIQPNDAGGIDAYVMKLDPTGQIVFSTYLGGSGNDEGLAVALDGFGGVWIGGVTDSPNFPTRNAFQNLNNGLKDVFITKIDAAGTAILYSTYFGGSNDDTIRQLAVDPFGSIFVAGNTASGTLPGAASTLQGSNAFVSKLNAAGTAVLNTLVKSGSLADFVLGSDGSMHLSANGAIEKYNASFQKVHTARMLDPAQVFMRSIAVDAQGSIYATGAVVNDTSASPNEFPVVNSFRPHANTDIFVMKLSADGTFPVYSTLLSGTCPMGFPRPSCADAEAQVGSIDHGYAIAVDSRNRAYVAGVTNAWDFPVTDGSTGGGFNRISQQDAVVFVLDTTVSHSTTLFTRLEESFPVITFTGTWYNNFSPTSPHSGRAAKLAVDAGAAASVKFTGAGEVKWFGCRDLWSGIAKVFLDGNLQAVVDTYSATNGCRQLLWSMSGIPAGSHTLTIQVTGTKNPASQSKWIWIDTIEFTSIGDVTFGPPPAEGPSDPGGAPGGTGTTFTRFEQTHSAIQYTGTWYSNSNALDSGGSAVLAVDTGTRATFTFSGTAAKWIGLKDPYSGIALVYVDGVFKQEVDAYSANTQFKTALFTIEGLSSGTHTLTIEVAGRRNTASNGRWVWVDAFESASGSGSSTPGTTTRVEQNGSGVALNGSWVSNSHSFHSGGSAAGSVNPGDRVTFTFTGTAVKLIAYRDEWSGIAKVYVDGVLKGEIDAYASPFQARAVLYSIQSLTAGTHTLTIEVTGRRNTSSQSSWLWVDAFEFQ